MNPFDKSVSRPNYWLSCLIVDDGSMCKAERSGRSSAWERERGKTCPDEILEALSAFGAEGRPIWKPMHLQPMYRNHGFVTAKGSGKGKREGDTEGSGIEKGVRAENNESKISSAYAKNSVCEDVASDLFRRGLCLPSDVKMSVEQQETVMEVIRRCFR